MSSTTSKFSLNVVALLYGWSVLRFARRRTAGPDEVEAVLSANKLSRPRFVVLYLLGGYLLEIGGAAVVGAVAMLIVARPAAGISHALSRMLYLVGALLAAFPLSMTLAVCLWAAFPDKRSGGFFRHPERLWLPSVLTTLLTILGGLALWR
jgi:hypothetical protein